MWYMFLDESGDLGFDYANKNPSIYFTVAILALAGSENKSKVENGVKRTLKRKLNPLGSRRRSVQELKGARTSLEVKKYFFRQINNARFDLFALSLNKRNMSEKIKSDSELIYIYTARLLLEKIPFENVETGIVLVVDKSKGKREIVRFNNYVQMQLKERINPGVPLEIRHLISQETPGLQAVDMFCYGVHRKYEKKETSWYDVFSDKLKHEVEYK